MAVEQRRVAGRAARAFAEAVGRDADESIAVLAGDPVLLGHAVSGRESSGKPLDGGAGKQRKAALRSAGCHWSRLAPL
jgi:hypothetical protein